MKLSVVRSVLLLAAASWVVTGCGGGSSSNAAGGSGATSFAFGDLGGRAAVSNPPVTTSNSFCAATAFTGTFSSLNIREFNPRVADTRIIYSTLLTGTPALFSSSIDGSDVFQISPGPDFDPSVSSLSGKIAFRSVVSNDNQIFVMKADGSGRTQLTATSGGNSNPSIDAAGDRVAFINNDHLPEVVDVATKVITPLQIPAGGDCINIALSPDGKTVFLVFRHVGIFDLLLEPSDASALPTTVLSGQPAMDDLAFSQDGTELAIIEEGSPQALVRIGTGDHGALKVNLPAGSFEALSYSPAGNLFATAFLAPGASAFVINSMSLDGTNLVPISDPISMALDPSWSGFTRDRVLISSGGGLLGTRACGVVDCKKGSSTTSVVAFDVTTPSSVVMTAQTPNGNAATNLVFSADADTITKLAFANTSGWQGIRVIGSGTATLTANGALISLDAVKGTVVSILPFNGSRAFGSRPSVHDEGFVRVFSGSFLAVYDKDGKNLAPSGASTVRLDMRTNTLSVG